MRSGFLKRSLIVLLMLAVASVWQAAPSIAAQPCGSATVVAAGHPSGTGHCTHIVGDCTKAAMCCQVAPNLLGASASAGTLIRWEWVVYSANAETFAGLRLKPALRPPSDRV